jgi:hypothetical protein
VAKSTHTGIPWLRIIRRGLGPSVHFWPFDGWVVAAGRSAIAEVYPALWSRSFAHEDRGADQHDAYSVAAWLSRADHDGSLAAFMKPDLTGSERTMAEVEGWMLGVAGHGRPTSRSPIRRWKAHHPSGIHSAEARPFVVLDFREGEPSAFQLF